MSDDVFAWLDSLGMFAIELGLGRIRELCRRLGEPQGRFRSVIVAGTNGKGSVATMIATGLRASGRRTALYTSPHLVRLEERFVVDGAEAPRERLAAALERVREAASGMAERPTYFEVATAAGFLLFAEERCEWAVLEVGLGGRLDATNAAEPDLSVITRIGLDHTEWLGPTIAAIAREKAGVMRAGRPVVIAPQEEEAREALRAEAARLGAVTVSVRADAPMPYRPLLLGAHQLENARVAAAALPLLGCPAEAVRAGIEQATLPGRLQTIPGDPPLLLDGAHNPQAARALAAHLDTLFPPPVLLFGCMRDKDARGVLAEILPRVCRAVFTAVDSPRAARPEELLALARELRPELGAEAAPSVAEALARARDAARAARATLLVCGSFYLVGDVLRRIP